MLKGKLVSVRTMEAADLAEVKAINDDPGVRGNVVGWGWPNSAAEMERWHAGSQGGGTHRWIVEDDENRVIGVTGLWDVDWQSRNALTALKLGGVHDVRGRGLGTDAIKLVMAFAFYDVGLIRLHSSILTTNRASLKAYVDKCGWSVEGTSREHVWRHGKFVDLHQVGILKQDFDRLPDAEDYITLVTGRP
ncbi:GNAT family N-acetyltransferase [Nocardioides jensenii]|uniref:GNAT family N-acetyltransferase n=1 Tax=Nocardioides jensenii TaxID=1843 RepID=UPI000A760699|nr:GNAT family protein [Nocardioides jensenii]